MHLQTLPAHKQCVHDPLHYVLVLHFYLCVGANVTVPDMGTETKEELPPTSNINGWRHVACQCTASVQERGVAVWMPYACLDMDSMRRHVVAYGAYCAYRCMHRHEQVRLDRRDYSDMGVAA